jgi:hypothetical protein
MPEMPTATRWLLIAVAAQDVSPEMSGNSRI